MFKSWLDIKFRQLQLVVSDAISLNPLVLMLKNKNLEEKKIKNMKKNMKKNMIMLILVMIILMQERTLNMCNK